MAGAPTRFQKIVRTLVRIFVTVALLTVGYFQLSLDRASIGVVVIVLVAGLAVLIALVVFEVRSVMRSDFPGLRAVESLATSVPLFLLLFASTYVAMQGISAQSFSEPMTHTSALYFTVTTFATVGYGDITPTSQAARVVQGDDRRRPATPAASSGPETERITHTKINP
jgi:small-conductance mechanosensitive channel